MSRTARSLLTLAVLTLAGVAAHSQAPGSIAAPAQTGQTLCYAEGGTVPNAILCSGTGHDGDLRKGIKWSQPRFVINGDGTVTDTLTHLMWLQNGNCIGGEYPAFDTDETAGDGKVSWDHAFAFIDGMNDGSYPNCGLGFNDWRLPNFREIASLLHYDYFNPALCNTSCGRQWSDGEPFTNLTTNQRYWTSTTMPDAVYQAGSIELHGGTPVPQGKDWWWMVWPVRGGRLGAAGASGAIVLADGGIQYPDGSLQLSGGGSPLPLLRTGQTSCYQANGTAIPCSGTGQDGEIQAGEPWPSPRFTVNGDGTVTDNLTALIWLADAYCSQSGANWADSLAAVEALADGSTAINGGDCGLSDGSKAGEWRLPSLRELLSLFHYDYAKPAISNAAGSGQWTEGDPFTNHTTIDRAYWTSTSAQNFPRSAFVIRIGGGDGQSGFKSDTYPTIWPVRGGR